MKDRYPCNNHKKITISKATLKYVRNEICIYSYNRLNVKFSFIKIGIVLLKLIYRSFKHEIC